MDEYADLKRGYYNIHRYSYGNRNNRYPFGNSTYTLNNVKDFLGKYKDHSYFTYDELDMLLNATLLDTPVNFILLSEYNAILAIRFYALMRSGGFKPLEINDDNYLIHAHTGFFSLIARAYGEVESTYRHFSRYDPNRYGSTRLFWRDAFDSMPYSWNDSNYYSMHDRQLNMLLPEASILEPMKEDDLDAEMKKIKARMHPLTTYYDPGTKAIKEYGDNATADIIFGFDSSREKYEELKKRYTDTGIEDDYVEYVDKHSFMAFNLYLCNLLYTKGRAEDFKFTTFYDNYFHTGPRYKYYVARSATADPLNPNHRPALNPHTDNRMTIYPNSNTKDRHNIIKILKDIKDNDVINTKRSPKEDSIRLVFNFTATIRDNSFINNGILPCINNFDPDDNDIMVAYYKQYLDSKINHLSHPIYTPRMCDFAHLFFLNILNHKPEHEVDHASIKNKMNEIYKIYENSEYLPHYFFGMIDPDNEWELREK